MKNLNKSSKIFLQGMDRPVKTKIIDKFILSQDTYILRCQLPQNTLLGLPIG